MTLFVCYLTNYSLCYFEVVVQEKSAMNGKNKQGSAINNASLKNGK